MLFNRNPFTLGKPVEAPDAVTIKTTPSLWNASLDDAALFGGELTREVLQAVDLVGDRKYVTVDTKIHMLMKGMTPAMPGWHTDGVPRDRTGNPAAVGVPMLDVQEKLDAAGKAPRYHLLVTGPHAPTEFLTRPAEISIPLDIGSDLYKHITTAVNNTLSRLRTDGDLPPVESVPPSQWVDWDWWNIHRAQPAMANGWRFLIRVTESDFLPPQTDIRQIIRLHNPVYLSGSYGW